MEKAIINSPIGFLGLSGDSHGLSSVTFIDEMSPISFPEIIPKILKTAVLQLNEYFEGKRKSFDLKLTPNGTDFQKRVWNELKNISYGKTSSYQQIAILLGDPKVIRAAATANGKNPLAIIIPCHRVIGSDGSLTGYAGGLHRKKWLLEHENPVKQQTLF